MAERLDPPIGTRNGLPVTFESPRPSDEGFLIRAAAGTLTGHEVLLQPVEAVADRLGFAPNFAYERYLRMHKVFVGNEGAKQLESIHESLQAEYMPQYLDAAGWAAAEAALVRDDMPTKDRLGLLDSGIDCWQRATRNQKAINENGPDYLAEYDQPFRMALNIAVAPLLRGVVVGDVTLATCRSVYEDCLKIAQANLMELEAMAEAGNIDALGQHIGFAYECNALLAYNRRLSSARFMIPATSRSDSGHYYRDQTHDLIAIHQKRGKIMNATPVEIKSAASRRDKLRYRALLVRGKMHLSTEGKFSPDHTLNALTACYEKRATHAERRIAHSAEDRLVSMVRDYHTGQQLGSVATNRSCTVFRDNSLVVANHPGLLALPA